MIEKGLSDMFEIIISVLINFLALSCLFIIWRLVGSVNAPRPIRSEQLVRSGERSAHSNLSLVTLGIGSFFVFPMLLVGVRWSEFSKSIDMNGYLCVLGFLLMGIVSYLYFIRALKGGVK